MPFPVAGAPPVPAVAPVATASATAVVARLKGLMGSADRLPSVERLTAETAALRDKNVWTQSIELLNKS